MPTTRFMASPRRVSPPRRHPGFALAFAVVAACGEPDVAPPDLSALPPLPDAVTVADAARGAERPMRELAIALVGEVRAEIEPCGCPTLPYGGFARREALLNELRSSARPLLHLDAGELLLKGQTTTRAEAKKRRAELLLELSVDVGVDAWAPGPSDLLALGLEGLDALRSGALVAPPAVSATWEDASGDLLLPPSRVVEAGDLRVGVIGMSAPPQGREVRDLVRARPLAAAARSALAALPEGLDLVVALGALGDTEAEELAAAVPELDLVLTTRGGTVDPPRRVAGVGPLIVETPDRGRYLQVAELRLGTDRGAPLLALPPADEWRQLQTARRQVAQALEAGSPELAERQARLDGLEEAFSEAARGRNLIHVEALPLGEDLDPGGSRTEERPEGPTTLADRIADYKTATLVDAEVAAAAPAPDGVARYASSGACVTCHAQEFARWGFTQHARAWMPLRKAGETNNPECVGCHSTAFGEPGGFGELTEANIRKWKAVQCESCHGPLLGHPDDPSVAARPVEPSGCVRCHDAANSPEFDFTDYLPRASCQPTERAPAGGEGAPSAPPQDAIHGGLQAGDPT